MTGRKSQLGPADIKAKKAFIRSYFDELGKRLDRSAKLLKCQEFFFEAILVLLCHIGSFARLRFPQPCPDHLSYKRIVLEYSGQRRLYEKVDLLFLYQWPSSELRNEKRYKQFKNYKTVKRTLESHFGDENAIQQKTRFVTQDSIIKRVKKFPGLDINNLKKQLTTLFGC